MVFSCEAKYVIDRKMQLLNHKSAPSRHIDQGIAKLLHFATGFAGKADYL